ncbi:hypothetical protein LguiB_021534 [Lonicera macranthoides]
MEEKKKRRRKGNNRTTKKKIRTKRKKEEWRRRRRGEKEITERRRRRSERRERKKNGEAISAFTEESAVLLPSSLDELNDFVNNSLLGKLVLMLCVSLSEIDLEIYNLMHEIESNKELESGKIVELDYLWGNAAINIRRERELEKDMDCSLVLNVNKK